MTTNRRQFGKRLVTRTTDAPSPSDDAVFDQFRVQVHGFLAEADLRGMSPVAVFFEWLDEMDADCAAAILVALPRATRISYAEWRRSAAVDRA